MILQPCRLEQFCSHNDPIMFLNLMPFSLIQKKTRQGSFACVSVCLIMWLLLFMRLLLFQIWLWWWRNCWPFMTIFSRSPSLTPWVGMVGGTDILYFSLVHSCMVPKQVSLCKGSDCFAQTSVHIFVSEVMDVSNVVNQASCGCKLFKQIIFYCQGLRVYE